jgi:hypothetical protein
MMLKVLVLAVAIAVVIRSLAHNMFLVWTLHGEKKHDAKNDLPAKQRRLSPETDFEKMRPTASRNLTRRVAQ